MILTRGLYSDNLSGNTGAPRHLIPSSKLEPISVKILNQNCLHFLSDSVGHSMPYVTLRQKYKMKIFLRNSIIVCFSICNSKITRRKYLLLSRVIDFIMISANKPNVYETKGWNNSWRNILNLDELLSIIWMFHKWVK